MGLGLTGCTALVTGASTGLGRTVAERLVRVGTDVAVAGSAGGRGRRHGRMGTWPMEEGAVGAAGGGGYAVGVLVQSSFGGILQIAGGAGGRALGRYYNSMFRATTVSSRWGTREMLPIEAVLDVLRRHGMVP